MPRLDHSSVSNSEQDMKKKIVSIDKVYLNTQGKIVSVEIVNSQQNKDAVNTLLLAGCNLKVGDKFKTDLNNSTCIISTPFLAKFFRLWGFTYSFKTLASERVHIRSISYGETKQIGLITEGSLKNPKSISLNNDCFIKEVLLTDGNGSFTVPAKLFYVMARFLKVFNDVNIRTKGGRIYLTKWRSKLILDEKGKALTEREFKLVLDFIEKYYKALPSNIRKVACVVTSMFIDNAFFQGVFGVETKDDGSIKFLTLEDSMKMYNGRFTLVPKGTSFICATRTLNELTK